MIKEKKLKPFTQPKIDLKKYEKNEPIQVEIKIDLEPEIKLQDFKLLELSKYEINLDKSLVNNNYKEFLKSQKKYSKIINNRVLIKTDKALINLVQKKLKKGDKVTLSLDISKSLKLDKEKMISFDVEIIDIEELIPFVVDKEFLDKSGLKNEQDLQDNLEKNFKSQYGNGLKQIEKKELMDTLEKNHIFDLPQGILDQEFKDIWHRIEHAKKDGSLDEDDKNLSDDELKKRYEKISKRRVKLALLLQFISRENKISIDEKELSNGMMQYASQYPGQEKEIIEYFKKNPSAIETVRGPLLEEKVIDSIVLKAKINKIKVTKEEYEKLEKKVFDVKKGDK